MASLSVVRIVCVAAFALLSCVSGFIVSPTSRAGTTNGLHAPSRSLRVVEARQAPSVLRMADEDLADQATEKAEEVAQQAEKNMASFFAPNENVRLGSSRDQDGKSNVWAVEPKMRVEGKDVEDGGGQKFIVAGGIIAAAIIAVAATVAFLPAPDSL